MFHKEMFYRIIIRKITLLKSSCFFSSVFIILLVNVLGCSPASKHKTLALFFDGVPDPLENQTTNIPDSAGQPSKFTGKNKIPDRAEIASSVFHPPYRQKKCGVCHDQGAMGKLKNIQTVVCYQCHEDFSEKYKKVHGPVGGGYCTACHSPHMSDNQFLLKRSSQQVCLFCHDSGKVLGNLAHKEIANTNCTECHNPHGGDDRLMLNKMHKVER